MKKENLGKYKTLIHQLIVLTLKAHKGIDFSHIIYTGYSK